MNYSNSIYRVFKPSRMQAIDLACKVQYFPKNELNEFSNSKFLSLISHVKTNVPYYSNILNDLNVKSIDDIVKLPVLTKKLIIENQESLKAINFKTEHLIPNSTSGSTGENLSFFSDKTEFYGGACQKRGNFMNGYTYGDKYLVLWGAKRDMDQAWTSKAISKYIKRRITLSSFSMTNEEMARYVGIINRFKPKLIVGYPTGLHLLSDFILTNNLKIHPPKIMVSGGETLFEFHREKIQQAFRAKLINRYGSREVNHIAGECENQSGLHISNDHVIIEIIDENGNRCKPGQIGEILVTDLDNYAFPFIRYKIGDLGIRSDKKCSCGRSLPLLEKIEGRIFDIVTGTNNNHVTGNYWTLLRNKINGIEKIQVIQEKKNEIQINLQVGELFNDHEYNNIIKNVKNQLGNDLAINIDIVDDIPLTESGKFRWVISKVSPYLSDENF